MDHVAQAYRLLADPVRLRALRAIAREELAAGEVSQVLGIAPSTTSKHLAALRTGGLLAERRHGRHVFFAVPPAARTDPRWAGVLERLAEEPDAAGDLARLDDVLRARRETPEEDSPRSFVPGRSWTAWARALTWLVPRGLRVVDLGCGEGALAVEIGRFAARVVGVDRREAAVRSARALAARRGAKHVRFEVGDFEAPDLPVASFDVAVLSQALHSAADPVATLRAARRLLVPGGRVLVLDLLPHEETWVRERLGHAHLGFAPGVLAALLRDAGFAEVAAERVAGRAGDPFKVVLGTGTVLTKSRKPRTEASAGRASVRVGDFVRSVPVRAEAKWRAMARSRDFVRTVPRSST
jgi:SAM-dependent methyltransferase